MKNHSRAFPGLNYEGGFYNVAGQRCCEGCWSPPGPVSMHSQAHRIQWRIARVMQGVIDDGTCSMLPAYTGGAGRPVAVDGQLRTPACFGSRGEPWAYPLGTGRSCDIDYEPVVVVHDTRRKHLVLVNLLA